MANNFETIKQLVLEERESTHKLRQAIQFCKDNLQINTQHDLNLNYEERVNFEKCLTENFLLKHGMDYFGKKDLIYLDLYGMDEHG